MSNKIKAVIGVVAIAIVIGLVVILVVNSQNSEVNEAGSTNTSDDNETNVVNEENTDNEINSTENTLVNNTSDDQVKEEKRDYSKKTIEEWKEAVKNFYDNNSSVMPDKIEVKDDTKKEKIIITTYDSEGHNLDEFEVDKRTWLVVGFEGNTIDFIEGRFIEIELHPKIKFKGDEEIAIAVYKTEEEQAKLIEKYFESAEEFNKNLSYNYGAGQKLLIIPRYDTVFISLTDAGEYNPIVEEARGKSILVNVNAINKTYSLIFSHLVNNTVVELKSNQTTGLLEVTQENERVKILTLAE